MAKSPDHMKGILALPSTQAYTAAVAAARTSATRTPEERRAVQNNLETLRMQAMRDRNEAFPLETNPFGKHGTLAKSINRQLQKEVNQRVADSAPKHARLISEVPSTCLSDLSWKDGVAEYSFYRGGKIDYSTPMSKELWIEWVSSESIGIFGNQEVFD
jgi:hypothetical protein